jgi:hypothetical protein
MVHAVSHLASRIPSFAAAAKLQPKVDTTTFATSLKSLAGTPAATPASTAATPPNSTSPDTSLKALFGQPIPAASTAAASPPVPAAQQVPTAESVFGANPWMTAPSSIGPNGITYYNPIFFATPATAQKVAQMVGGTAVQLNPNSGPFQQQQGNWMVQLPNGKLINPGIVASFYTHGYPQGYIQGMIADTVRYS